MQKVEFQFKNFYRFYNCYSIVKKKELCESFFFQYTKTFFSSNISFPCPALIISKICFFFTNTKLTKTTWEKIRLKILEHSLLFVTKWSRKYNIKSYSNKFFYRLARNERERKKQHLSSCWNSASGLYGKYSCLSQCMGGIIKICTCSSFWHWCVVISRPMPVECVGAVECVSGAM